MKIPFVFFLSIVTCCLSEREHKVHNIVLYPDRHSWCQTTPIKQIVASPGYGPVTIDNNVCVGACYSYSIPKTQPAEPGELIGPYCDSCKPVETRCYHVTLHDDKNSTKTVQKRVQIITNCSCSSCEKNTAKDCEITDQNTSELPMNLFATLNPTTTTSTTTTEDAQKVELPDFLVDEMAQEKKIIEADNKLVNVLKNMRNDNEEARRLDYDKEQLKQLLEIVEGMHRKIPAGGGNNDLKQFIEFVKVHDEEDLKFDFTRLKEVVDLVKKSQTKKNNNNELHPNQLVDPDVKKMLEDPIKMHHHHHHHHHKIGEEEILGADKGRLMPGPHGSLTFVPEEKLNLDAHLIKPNNAGTVIDYENQPKKRRRRSRKFTD